MSLQSESTPKERFAQFKLVLLGESAVGKSSIVHRFVKNTFDDLRESTIGAAFLTQQITIPESQTTIKFEIWDTAGQERYKSLAPMYYRNANAALCVYDITNKSSFNKAQDWIKELKKQAPEGIVIAIVGNKLDLNEEREIDQQEIEDYIQEQRSEGFNIINAECSAKTGDGVLEIFDKIGRALPIDEVIDNNSRQGTVGGRRTGGVDLNRTRRQQVGQSSCC